MPFTGLKNIPHIRNIIYGIVFVILAITLQRFGLWADMLQLIRELLAGAGLIDLPITTEVIQ